MFERYDEKATYPHDTEFGVQRSDGTVVWKGTPYWAAVALKKALRKDPGAYLVVRPFVRTPFTPPTGESKVRPWSWPPEGD